MLALFLGSTAVLFVSFLMGEWAGKGEASLLARSAAAAKRDARRAREWILAGVFILAMILLGYWILGLIF